jgi:Isoleucyl-tRNA synthetase
MFVKAPFKLDRYFVDIIEDELNVKAVEFTDDVRSYTTYTFKPQLRTVGPKYGKLLGQIRAALDSLDGNAAMDELKSKGVLTLTFGEEKAELSEEDLLIDMTQTPGYATESNGDVTVVLDGNLTPELIDEGYVREIISKVQTMRKEAGFEVMDHITLYHKDNAEISRIMETYTQEVAGDVLADEVIAGEPEGYVKEWDINGQKVVLGVKKK